MPTIKVNNVPSAEELGKFTGDRSAVAAQEPTLSGWSTGVYQSTLFRAFSLVAESTYNFFTRDEAVPPTFDTSGSLSNLPRYVTLRWKVAPKGTTRKVGQKTVRPSEAVPPKPAAEMSVAVASLSNGYTQPGAIAALLVDPAVPETVTSFDEDSFLLSPTAAGSVAGADTTFSTRPTQQLSAPVTFVDPSIAGMFDPNRISVSVDPLHLAVAGSAAKLAGALEVLSEFNQDVGQQNPAPTFPAQPGTPTVVYVGYVIERYDMMPDGSMVLGRTVLIDDITTHEFVDQRVAYDGQYAYRIRPIVQWTRTSDIDFAGVSTIDRPSAFSALVVPPLASFYAGNWSDWARTRVVDTVPPEPPDEVTVRPVSWRGEIRVSWKVGNDPQGDLTRFCLVRSRTIGERISDWKEIADFPVANGSYVDRDVSPYEQGNVGYTYALYARSVHGVDSPLSDQVHARLSPSNSREELPVIQIAPRGADRTAHASGRMLPDSTEVKATKQLTFYCRQATSGHPLRPTGYLIEARSLSTGERVVTSLVADAIDIGVVDA